jgi:hypothetical protein
VERSVDSLPEKDRVERGLALAHALIETLAQELGQDRREVLATDYKARASLFIALEQRHADNPLLGRSLGLGR